MQRWRVKIRTRTLSSGKTVWQLDAGLQVIDGKRKRVQKLFPTQAAAQAALKAMKATKQRQGSEGLSLSTDLRVRYQRAEEQLAAHGLSLDEAVAIAIRHGKRSKGAIELEALWDAFRADRQRLKRDPDWIKKLRVAIEGFIAGRELQLADLTTTEQVRDWIFSDDEWSPRTQKNYLAALSSMFTWAVQEGYLAVNPCKGIALPTAAAHEPGALSVEQCSQLLTSAWTGLGPEWDYRERQYQDGHVWRPLLGMVVLGMFGGIRPRELERSPRALLELEHSVVVVAARHAKPGRGGTRRKRVVELPANAVAWLRLWSEACPGDWIVPAGYRHLWKPLRVAAGCWPWPHDALRHTCASMHYAKHQDEGRLKAMLGHSDDEDTLFRNYRAVFLPDGRMISPAMAESFYSLLPDLAPRG